jgi:hypothetical protein
VKKDSEFSVLMSLRFTNLRHSHMSWLDDFEELKAEKAPRVTIKILRIVFGRLSRIRIGKPN